jgi:hypothetical protein
MKPHPLTGIHAMTGRPLRRNSSHWCHRPLLAYSVEKLISQAHTILRTNTEVPKNRSKHAVWRIAHNRGRRSSETTPPSARANFSRFKGLDFFRRNHSGSFSTE